jgi:hypothetical protein
MATKLNPSGYGMKAYISLAAGGARAEFNVRLRPAAKQADAVVKSVSALVKLADEEKLHLLPLPRPRLTASGEHFVPAEDWLSILGAMSRRFLKQSPLAGAWFHLAASPGMGATLTLEEIVAQREDVARWKAPKPRTAGPAKSGAKADTARTGTRARASSR